MKKIFLFLSIIILIILSPSSSQAGNPTQYITPHDPYTRLSEGKMGGFSSTLQYYQGYDNYTPFFRIFIPPGSTNVDLRIVDGGDNVAIARHNQYPLGNPDPKNTSVTWRYKFALSELEKSDCYVKITNEEVLYVLYDGLRGLSPNRGGWLYVKVGGGRAVSYFQIQWHVVIFPEHISTYNDWWDNYGSNPDGSINWEKDVESVYQYHPYYLADINRDKKVDIYDYNLLKENYNKTIPQDQKNLADINRDKVINIYDYNELKENYGESSE